MLSLPKPNEEKHTLDNNSSFIAIAVTYNILIILIIQPNIVLCMKEYNLLYHLFSLKTIE